eukprot:444768_1
MAEAGEPIAEDAYTSTEEVLSAISGLITFLLTLILTIVHGSKFYSDLFTVQRTVLNHTRNKSKITPIYKQIAYLTFASVCFFCCILLAEVIQYNLTIGSCQKMFSASVIDKFFYFSCKCTLYLIFILRIHEVYGQSAYGYKTKNLICIGVTVIIISITLFVAMVI